LINFLDKNYLKKNKGKNKLKFLLKMLDFYLESNYNIIYRNVSLKLDTSEMRNVGGKLE